MPQVYIFMIVFNKETGEIVDAVKVPIVSDLGLSLSSQMTAFITEKKITNVSRIVEQELRGNTADPVQRIVIHRTDGACFPVAEGEILILSSKNEFLGKLVSVEELEKFFHVKDLARCYVYGVHPDSGRPKLTFDLLCIDTDGALTETTHGYMIRTAYKGRTFVPKEQVLWIDFEPIKNVL